MERIQSINARRMEWCCTDYGTTPYALASELNISSATMARVMRGEEGLTFPQLSKIASFFGRGVLFFLEPGPVDATQVHTAAFRTLANQKPELAGRLKRLIEHVERQREIYLSLREALDNADLPRFEAPALPRDHPSQAARIARQWLGLAKNNTFDSYRAAVEARGVLVFRSNGYHGKWRIAKKSLILGFSLYDRDCPVIVVRKQDSESQQSFTLMHELGHLLLHRRSAIDDAHDMQSHQGHERDANAFAGHLLVPAAFLAEVEDRERPRQISEFDEWLKALRKTWGVSTEVILRRLLDTDRLPQAQYAAYRAWRSTQPIAEQEGGSRMYRHREPSHIFGHTFVRTVLDALHGQYITLAKASHYLDGLKINGLFDMRVDG